MTKMTPIKGWSEKILPEWTDYNRHMNVGYYTLIFDHGVDVFFEKIGGNGPEITITIPGTHQYTLITARP